MHSLGRERALRSCYTDAQCSDAHGGLALALQLGPVCCFTLTFLGQQGGCMAATPEASPARQVGHAALRRHLPVLGPARKERLLSPAQRVQQHRLLMVEWLVGGGCGNMRSATPA